ncbi:MAG: adenosylcobalamin-dependent ribonucleoside-diphosphate reductase, partial [archaeon]
MSKMGEESIAKSTSKRYDPMEAISSTKPFEYNSEKHLTLSDAYKLLESQGDDYLKPARLDRAIAEGKLTVYSTKKNGIEERYVERLDLGRALHEKKAVNGLSIERYFTDGKTDPYAAAGEFGLRDVELKNRKGEVVFSMSGAEFPVSWDDLNAKIVAQKYLFKPHKTEWKEALKSRIGYDQEKSLKHLVSRVVHFFADEGERFGYFKTNDDKQVFEDELKHLLITGKAAFNSPVQFNAGLFNEYGITGSHGINYWKDPKSGEVIKIENGCNIRPQCHACFIKGPTDDLESILQHIVDEGAVFSSGSGIGQGIDSLRAEGEKLSSGGKSSGPLSFWKILDINAGSIKSGGKSRRAARMTTMREFHPDVREFIFSKVNEDKKALTLLQAGYDGGKADMDGVAYGTVAYQNTNISIRLTNDLFEKVKSDGVVDLRRVTDGVVVGQVKARRLLQEISYGSWRVGDPAVQYEDKIQEYHTAKNSGKINSSNPCSEYMFLDNTSCNLTSLNLLKFSDSRGRLDVESYGRAVRILAFATDIANNAASYPIKEIAKISPEFRTIGIGYAGLGNWLMRNGKPYDSDEGRALAAAATAITTGKAYEASAEMARDLGSFEHFEFNKKPMLEVMNKHRKNLESVLWAHVPEDLKSAAMATWDNVVSNGEKYGFRNAQTTVIAPTGTISFLMETQDSTGGEPASALSIFKSLAGGGQLVIANKEVPNALANLGYGESQRKDISDFAAKHNTVRGAPHLNPDHYNVFDTSFGNENGDGSIGFEGHVRMLGAQTPFVSGAISKTNNLPASATVKDIYDGYILGHRLGLKALAVFRNDSKPVSVLSVGEKGFLALKRGEKEDLVSRRSAHEFESKIHTPEGEVPFHILVS